MQNAPKNVQASLRATIILDPGELPSEKRRQTSLSTIAAMGPNNRANLSDLPHNPVAFQNTARAIKARKLGASNGVLSRTAAGRTDSIANPCDFSVSRYSASERTLL